MSVEPGDRYSGMNESERQFATYLNLYGYQWEHEPDLGPAKRADFLVTRGGDQMLCEVKAFVHGDLFSTPLAPLVDGAGTDDVEEDDEGSDDDEDSEDDEDSDDEEEVGGSGSGRGLPRLVYRRDPTQMVKPIRGQLREAAKKYREFAGLGLPLVDILVNDCHLHIPMHDQAIVSAMYGDASVRLSLDSGEATVVLGRNGALTNHGQYISGVGVLRVTELSELWLQEWKLDNADKFATAAELIADLQAKENLVPRGVRLSIDLFETASDTAVPIPRTEFTGEFDERYSWAGASCVPLEQTTDGWAPRAE